MFKKNPPNDLLTQGRLPGMLMAGYLLYMAIPMARYCVVVDICGWCLR